MTDFFVFCGLQNPEAFAHHVERGTRPSSDGREQTPGKGFRQYAKAGMGV